MFQRQTRSSFPIGLIIIALALALGFFIFLYKAAQEKSQEAAEKANGDLWPSEWFYALRDYPVFRPDVRTYLDALQAAKNGDQQRPQGSPLSAPWRLEGPGNIGARINSIKVHPLDQDIIYLGYSGGGVWKTTNGGLDWSPIFDDQMLLSVSDIELDPQNPNTVYVGTGDHNISGYPFIGDGIWKSTDGGQNWQNIGLAAQRIISKIIIHPTNSNIIYAATMGLPFERNNDRGLYKTTNGGQTWEKVLYINNETGIISMVMSPTDPNVLYAAAWSRIRNNQESVISSTEARIWKTTDGGSTWDTLSGGLPIEKMSRIGLAIHPTNGDHVWAMYCNPSLSFGGIFQTTDGGTTWAQTLNDPDPDFQSNFAWYFGKIHINPFNPTDIWANGVTTQRSPDAGLNWSEGGGFQTGIHADHHDIAFITDQYFLLATDGGLYRTDNAGADWYKFDNIPTTQFYRVAWNPHDESRIYGGAQDNGSLGGNINSFDDWQHYYGGDGFQPAFHPTDPNIFYFESQNGGIGGTNDGGNNFGNGSDGIDDNDRRHWDMQYIISQHDPEIMYTGTYRAYSSYGHLPVWGPISEDLTDGVIFGSRFHTISTVNESPLDADLIYVGTTDGNVWNGQPATQTWTNVSAGLPDRYVSSVKASPSKPDRVFVSHTGYRSNDFTPRLHRSEDRGATWTPITGNLPNLAINDILILPGHQDSVIFVATDGGVYVTIHGGSQWERLGTGMPFVPVYDLAINEALQRVIAGTHARSIYTFPIAALPLGTMVPTVSPAQVQPTLRVFPTLAQSSVKIDVSDLTNSQPYELAITDLSGKTVFKNALQNSPNTANEIDITRYASGTYIVFVRSKGQVWASKKFVVNHP